jgi:hypothetical protein
LAAGLTIHRFFATLALPFKPDWPYLLEGRKRREIRGAKSGEKDLRK